MAPFNDALCGGSGVGNPLTSLLKQDTVDRSLHQDKLLHRSDDGLGQTMRSGSQKPTLNFQKAFDSFENQDAALQLVEMVGRDQKQEKAAFETAWSAAGEVRPFAGQYAEIDLILQQRADLGRRETKHGSGGPVARPESYGDETGIGSPPKQEQQPLSRELSAPFYPSYIHLSCETMIDMWYFHTLGEFANADELVKPVLPLNPSGELPEKWEHVLHYLDVYRIAVQDNLPDTRDAAIAMLMAEDVKMPDVNEGLQRGDFKPHTFNQPVSLSARNKGLPVHDEHDLLDTMSNEPNALLSVPRDTEIIGSVPKDKSMAVKLQAEWERRRIENGSNRSSQAKNATVTDTDSDTMMIDEEFDELLDGRPALLQFTRPLEDPKVTSTAEQLAKQRRRQNKAEEMKTLGLEENTAKFFDWLRDQAALENIHAMLSNPTEEQIADQMRAILSRKGFDGIPLARRAMRKMGIVVRGEEDAGPDIEMAWESVMLLEKSPREKSPREKSTHEKAAHWKSKRGGEVKNTLLNAAEQERHAAELKSQPISKSDRSYHKAGITVLDADGSEHKAVQESPIEEVPAPTLRSEIAHHSIMFRFLDKLYSSTPHKNTLDAEFSQMDRDHEYDGLRHPILLRQALNILKMNDNEELRILRDTYPMFRDELYSALDTMRQEYEEIVENEHGNLTLRLRWGLKMKAKL